MAKDPPTQQETIVAESLVRAERAKKCSHPVALRQPDGSKTWARCGSKSERECPFCARIHRFDKMRLIGSGCNIQEKDGITADSLAPYRFYFVTLTAPSFGKILAGAAIDFSRYKYEEQVRWNKQSSRLFKVSAETASSQLPEMEYAVVREWQARGAIHFHAIIRVPIYYSKTACFVALSSMKTVELNGFSWGKQFDLAELETIGKTVGYLAKVVSYSAKEQGIKGSLNPSSEQLEHFKRLDNAAKHVHCNRRNCDGPGCPGIAHRRFGYAGHMASYSKGWSLCGLTAGVLADERKQFASSLTMPDYLQEFSEALLEKIRGDLNWTPSVNDRAEQELLEAYGLL